MKINKIDSERIFTNLKSQISKLKKENSDKENPQVIEIVAEFDFDIKRYTEDNFPAKFSVLDEESKDSDKIIIHIALGGTLYNKSLLKRMEETQVQSQATSTPIEQSKTTESIFNTSAMEQLNQMLNMRDEMMNRFLMQGEKLAEARQELSTKGFNMQMEALKELQNQKVETLLDLSRQRMEVEVEKAKVTYQQGTGFWQELIKEGIGVFKENPSIILDTVDFIRELRAKPVTG